MLDIRRCPRTADVVVPPDIGEIEKAAERIDGVASRTPLVESPSLSNKFGLEVFLKLECFQPTRVFKIRGAYNKLSQTRSDSVVAASSGNHGLAVAYSAHLLGKRCTVVVPETAVQEKVSAISEFGARVVKFGRTSVEREARARGIAKEEGAEFVHPYDDPDVVAGQGTCGLEVVEQLGDLDSVIVPVGGGGLISGITVAVKSRRDSVRVFGVEPVAAAKLAASLKAGRMVAVESRSLADGLVPSSIGEIAFQVCSKKVDGVYTVSEDQIVDGTRMMLQDAHFVAEPSGAAPLAALIAGSELQRLGKRVVLVVSGGNISLDLLKRLAVR